MIAETARGRVLAEARSWIGTPFHHGQGLKGRGVDCGQLLAKVFTQAGILAPFKIEPYSPTFHLHSDREIFLDLALARGALVPMPRRADIALFRFGRCYSHGAIISLTDPLTVIHAVHGYGRVVEEVVETNAELQFRMVKVLFVDLVGDRK